MSWKNLGVVMLIVAGCSNQADRFQEGQLDACKQVIDIVNSMMNVNTECVVYKGNVVLKLDNLYFSMDGKNKVD